MNPWSFAVEDRLLFERACAVFGGAPANVLRRWLLEGVWGEPQPIEQEARAAILGAVRRGLWQAGLAEIGGILPKLDRGTRAKVRRAWRGAGLTVPTPKPVSPAALRSLRAQLLSPPEKSADLVERAGLHRLARALADLDASALHRVTAQMAPAIGRALRAAWERLSPLNVARQEAADLRREFLEEDAR